MNGAPRLATFRQRLLARQPLVGTFLKTPNTAITEILGLSGLDCVCVDAEHAPFLVIQKAHVHAVCQALGGGGQMLQIGHCSGRIGAGFLVFRVQLVEPSCDFGRQSRVQAAR